MHNKKIWDILAVVVVLLMGIVCAGCIFNTPPPPVLENTTSLNTSGACVCECGTTTPTPLVTEREYPSEYWIITNPLANTTSGATINITGETNLPVDTRLLVRVLYPFRHHSKAHQHDIDGNITVAYVNPGNTSGVNTWMVAVNTTGYTPTGYDTQECEVAVFPAYGDTRSKLTYFYVNAD
jgi:hypothetical protein